MLCAACYWLLHRVLHSPGTPAHHVLLTTAACKMFHTPTSATHNTHKVGKLLLVVVVLCCCRDGRLYLLLLQLFLVGSVLSAADVVCCMLFVAGCLLWRLVVGS